MESMTLRDRIFYGNSLDAALRGAEQKMGEAAAAIPAEHALAQTVDQLTAELMERFHVESLVLDWEAVTVSSKDTKIPSASASPRRKMVNHGPCR